MSGCVGFTLRTTAGPLLSCRITSTTSKSMPFSNSTHNVAPRRSPSRNRGTRASVLSSRERRTRSVVLSSSSKQDCLLVFTGVWLAADHYRYVDYLAAVSENHRLRAFVTHPVRKVGCRVCHQYKPQTLPSLPVALRIFLHWPQMRSNPRSSASSRSRAPSAARCASMRSVTSIQLPM